jgi:hypothetical protein
MTPCSELKVSLHFLRRRSAFQLTTQQYIPDGKLITESVASPRVGSKVFDLQYTYVLPLEWEKKVAQSNR